MDREGTCRSAAFLGVPFIPEGTLPLLPESVISVERRQIDGRLVSTCLLLIPPLETLFVFPSPSRLEWRRSSFSVVFRFER